MTSKAFGLAQLGNVYSDGALSNRNLVINGAMQVAQRGTSFTGISGYGLDRHITDVFGGSTAVFNAEQSSDAPDGFSHSYKVTVSTAETPSGTDATSIFQHRIEGQNVQYLGWGDANVKHVTLSFWVKSSVTGDFPFGLEVFCTDSADDTGFMQTYTVNAANTWEFKTITIPLWDSSVSVVTPRGGNNFGILLRFGGGGVSTRQGVAGWQSRSTSLTGMSGAIAFTSNAAATWQITGVQLEAGDTATPFEHRSYGQELALCQRYFQQLAGNGASVHAHTLWTYSTLNGSSYVFFPTTMRAPPTGAVIGTTQNVSGGSVGSDKWSIYYNGAWRGCNFISINTLSQAGFRFDADSVDSMAGGGACGLYGGDQCNLRFSAEL
jgi:hypothetical protein